MSRITLLRVVCPALCLLAVVGTASGAWGQAPSVTNGAFRIDGGTSYPFAFGAPIVIPNATPPPSRIGEERSAAVGPVAVQALSLGPHLLEFMFGTSGGIASQWYNDWFYVTGPKKIKGAEWFIDTDPGPGHGTPIPAPADGVWNETEEDIVLRDVPVTGLAPGEHTVYVRAKDQDNLWSAPWPTYFNVGPPVTIVYAEWVSDPATPLGSGNPMTAADGAFDEQEEAVTYTGTMTPALCPTGHHIDICVRVRDSRDRWSYWWTRWTGTVNPNWPTAVEVCTPVDRLPGEVTPTPGDVMLTVGTQMTFSVGADPDGDTATHAWLLDGVQKSTASSYAWNPTAPQVGVHTLEVHVADGVDQITYTWHVTVKGVPIADFSADPVAGCVPLTVSFKDVTRGVPTSWSWNFGDGQTSTEQNPVHEYTRTGNFTVVLTAQNSFGSSAATKTSYIQVVNCDLRADRSFWCRKYASPGTEDITVTFYNDTAVSVTALGARETIPGGWSFVSVVSANPPNVQPSAGATGALEFRWTAGVPAFPVKLTYRLSVPAGQSGDKTFAGDGMYKRTGPELWFDIGPFSTISKRVYHSADYKPADYAISLSELLRLIQFYNSGAYHCQAGTEDGYAPGAGAQSGVPHDSDYNAQDWKINLSELLRLVQFYNLGGYHVASGTEDGFAPGPSKNAQMKLAASAAKTAPAKVAARQAVRLSGEGKTLDVTVDIAAAGGDPVTALGLKQTLPRGWKFKGLVAGTLPGVAPRVGASGELEFGWLSVKSSPVRFTYRVALPGNGSLVGKPGGRVIYRTSGDECSAAIKQVSLRDLAPKGTGASTAKSFLERLFEAIANFATNGNK